MENAGREQNLSENIGRFKYNYDFESTCRTWFYPGHINPRIGVVQETTDEPSETVFPELAGSGGPMNKRRMEGSLCRARCDMLLGIVKKVVSPILLHRGGWLSILIGNLNDRSSQER
jgi:hypothetical protein